jgi:acylphosphatase
MEAYAKRFPELGGYVRNCDDGRVEAVFCGKQAEVLQMVAWCGKGPVGSKVELLEVVEESPEASMPQFEVRH